MYSFRTLKRAFVSSVTGLKELPPPSPRNFSEHTIEAKRRLKREVIHRLASGSKTHSEMAEVSSILPLRDNLVLCKTVVNPDDASSAALEDALSEVAVRKQRSGAPDEWELQNDAWREYDPAFHHISIRAHQSATENRPKQSSSSPYAPRPAAAHISLKRIRRDLTADSCILAMIYRILHVHCCEKLSDTSLPNTDVRGGHMYDEKSKSETVLARAVHLLTLGAYIWEDDCSNDNMNSADWRDLGGGDVGSVFYNQKNAPNACEWINMALLREPSEVMHCEWYLGKENSLTLLKKIGFETGDRSGFLGGVDPALRSGAAFVCEYAAKFNPRAASAAQRGSFDRNSPSREQERKKHAAKEKALASMKAKMAKFAANIENSPGFDDDDCMSEVADQSKSSSRISNSASHFSTPLRRRSDSEAEVVDVMGLSPTREFILTSPIASPNSPSTPQTHTPRTNPHKKTGIRLMHERPQCIVCGGDSHDPMQVDECLSGDLAGNKNACVSVEGGVNNEKALAFCGYSQASTVIMGGNGVPSRGQMTLVNFQRHVGVHISLCGHAIHKDCCDAYLKTVASQRFDRIDSGKKREFRCPLCQRLSNCLVPFVDVAADWVDKVTQTYENDASELSTQRLLDVSRSQIDCSKDNERPQLEKASRRISLHDFLSTSKCWATRNDKSVSWDGHCIFSVSEDETKQSELSSISSPRQSFLKLQSKFGKKELVRAWSSVLRTPGSRRRNRSPSTYTPGFIFDTNSGSKQKESNSDVLRRFLDQVSDVAYKADMKRLGEEVLFNDHGEFRHYLSEKTAYNKDNRAAGKEMIDVSIVPKGCWLDQTLFTKPSNFILQWPMCISSTTLTESRRQELSREKLISKMIFSIQAFTYTCCSESAEARQLLFESSALDTTSIRTKFGLCNVLIGGNLLLLPEANPSVDGGYQPFDGRLGKLRYLSLALMAAASPVSLEVIQLCMSFPETQPDPFDFTLDDKSSTKRAPVTYPILCSHVLTHTTGALVAICGRARAEEEGNIDSVVDDCRNLLQLGLIARVSQVTLAGLRPNFDGDPVWEQRVCLVIEQNLTQLISSVDVDEQEWRHFGVTLVHTLLSQANSDVQVAQSSLGICSNDAKEISSYILHAIEAAETEVVSFLRELSTICQLLIPNIFHLYQGHQDDFKTDDSNIKIIKHFMKLFNIDWDWTVFDSDLLQEIMKSWYARSTGKSLNQLDFPRVFHGRTWPVTSCVSGCEIPVNCVPLLGNSFLIKPSENDYSPRIMYLPRSYTDLYSTLSELYPDSEQTAVCLVCGQVRLVEPSLAEI